MKIILKIVLSLIVIVIIALAAGIYALTTEKVQKWLFHESVTLLSEHLQTKIEADSLSINPWRGEFSLYGFMIEDKKEEKMLKVDTLTSRISMHLLLNRHINIKSVRLYGADINLYKERKDSATNFQFLVEEIKSHHKPKNDHVKNAHKTKLSFDIEDIEIKNTRIRWDIRNLVRKNVLKPKRGAFDTNHIDAVVNLEASLKQKGNDSILTNIAHLDIKDWSNGVDIKEIKTKFGFSKRWLTVNDLDMSFAKSKLHFSDAVIDIKGKAIHPFHLSSDIILKDISEAFSPALNHFTTPLHLDVDVKGMFSCIGLNNIKINTPDRQLTLTAHGRINNVTKKKEQLSLNFDNIKLNASHGIKETIIKHFAKKIRIKMVNQIKAVGDIKFHGKLFIPYKKEIISGTIFTHFGNVNTTFTVDGKQKQLYGSLRTDSLEIGKLMNIQKLHKIKTSATFSFDISKKVKTEHKGRLPKGWLKAEVSEARYQIFKAKDVSVDITSNGYSAIGNVNLPIRHLFDIDIEFNFIQTDDVQELKVKPFFHKHSKDVDHKKIIDKNKWFKIFSIVPGHKDDKASKKEKKARKKMEKEIRKAEKEQRKEQKREEKETSLLDA